VGTVSVSWLTLTLRADREDEVVWPLLRRLGGHSQSLRETPHYGRGVGADDRSWSVYWAGRGSNVGTVLTTVRQTRLEQPDGQPLAFALAGAGWRGRRVDLAGDEDCATAPRPRWYFDARTLATTRTDRGKWIFLEDGVGRQTLNAGSRTSERFLRLYDHAPGVLRHEIELKDGAAERVAAALGAGVAAGSLWAAEYGRMIQWPSL